MTIYDAELIYGASISFNNADGSTAKAATVASGKLQAISSLQVATSGTTDVLVALMDQDMGALLLLTVPGGVPPYPGEWVDILALITTVQEPYLWIRPDKYIMAGLPTAIAEGSLLTFRATYYQFAALPGFPV